VKTVSGTAAAPSRERRVLDAAVEVFWEKGYAAGSVREIADVAGLPKTSLYHVISSKDELLFRIFDESHRTSLAMMDEVAAMPGTPLARLRAYVERFVAYYVENIKPVGLYYRERRFIGGDRAATLRAQRRDYDRFVRGLIEAARTAGEADLEVEPTLATFFVIGALNDISEWYEPAAGVTPAEFAAAYAEVALASVTPA
jgi:AcrR family transcriptional regulator